MTVAAEVGGLRVAAVMEGVRVVAAVVEAAVGVGVTVGEAVEVTEAEEGEAVVFGVRSALCLSLEGWSGEGAGSLTGCCCCRPPGEGKPIILGGPAAAAAALPGAPGETWVKLNDAGDCSTHPVAGTISPPALPIPNCGGLLCIVPVVRLLVKDPW